MIAWILLLGALSLVPGNAEAFQDDPSLEELAIEWAETREQHEALARHYRRKADEALDDARLHRRMVVSYSGVTVGQRQRMKRHCRELADQYTAMAKEYNALADFHAAEAKRRPDE